jgi:dipeptidyl aminopeptidase/acylaminoacyl peptidase
MADKHSLSGTELLTRYKISHSSSDGNTSSISIVAGQTRPVAFNITLPDHNVSTITYNITYKTVDSAHKFTLQVSQNLKHVSIYRPHKLTYLHPGGMVSYAMLRPPAKNATCRSGQTKLPVLLALHGAGLEADDSMVTGLGSSSLLV